MDRILVFFCKLIARLPFRIIYGLSDIFYVLVFHVIRYRRKDVHMNLTRSFPEKSPEEIRQIMKKFYHHLCDLGLETIKLSRMSEEEMGKRITLHGDNSLYDYYNQGRSYILLGMHYNNWEWCLFLQSYLKSTFYVVYNPVRSNKALEKFILDARSRFGAQLVAVHQSVRTALEFNKVNSSRCLVLLADQTPPANSQFWTNFLNQETAFFAGPMKIAIKTNLPIAFHYIRKTGRGYYEAYCDTLIENPSMYTEEEITMMYIRKMEEIIKAEPEYWLWSHRRWKHKRPANIELNER